MLETVLAWIGSLLGMAGNATWVAIAGVLLAFIIKKYSKPDLYNQIYQGIYGLIFSIFAGITIVLNKATLGLWDKYLEPVFELALTSLLKAVMDGAVDGLNSDEVTAKSTINGKLGKFSRK